MPRTRRCGGPWAGDGLSIDGAMPSKWVRPPSPTTGRHHSESRGAAAFHSTLNAQLRPRRGRQRRDEFTQAGGEFGLVADFGDAADNGAADDDAIGYGGD